MERPRMPTTIAPDQHDTDYRHDERERGETTMASEEGEHRAQEHIGAVAYAAALIRT
jgi:hypothetical protein